MNRSNHIHSGACNRHLYFRLEIAMNSVTETAHLSIVLTDDERQPCEVWTRVMGYHRPVAILQRRQEGRALRALVLSRGASASRRSRSAHRRCTTRRGRWWSAD